MFKKAQKFHLKRSKKSRIADESHTSKIKHYSDNIPASWFKDPSTSDVIGIDTKKRKAKTIKEVILFLVSIQPAKLEEKNFTNRTKTKTQLKVKTGQYKNFRETLKDLIYIRYNNVTVRQLKSTGGIARYSIYLRK